MGVASRSSSLSARALPLLGQVLPFLPLLIPAGCGGGGVATIQPPPPAPDFILSVSPSSVTINQGSTSSAIQISIQPVNGFSGTVQVSLSSLPSGVSANLSSPFAVSSTESATLLLGATQTSATGNVAIAAQGTSGKLTHSASLALSVRSSVAPAVSHTTYLRTESVSSLNQPAGEPNHRHIIYDSANRHLFVANAAANRVEVFSTQDASRVASIDIPGASSVDLSPDGQSVYVGTTTSQIVAIDSGSLQLAQKWQLDALSPVPGTVFDRPEEVTVLSGGRALVRMRQANGANALLTLWNPADNSLVDLTSSAPQLFQNGVGAISRSGDHSRLLVAANDASGAAGLFDGAGAIVVAPKALGFGAILSVAGNRDGSQFGAVVQDGSGEMVLLLDGSLNVLATRVASSLRGISFSRDNAKLYLAETQNPGAVVTALDTTGLHLIGEIPDLSLQGVGSTIEETDDSGFVFGLGNRGLVFLDANEHATIPKSLASFANAPSVLPSSGPATGATSVTLTGANFGANPIVRIGTQIVASVSNSTPTQIQATTPASIAFGAANVTAYFQDGTVTLAPDAFSYGPQVLEVLPNAGGNSGGDTIALYGYGFGQDSGQVQARFGQSLASIQKIEDTDEVRNSLGLGASYPFPLQRIILISPPGSAGKVDVVVTSPAGSTTISQGFQYLKSSRVYPKANFYKFATYDRKRRWVYASDIDHVDVFDADAGIFNKAIVPPGGPAPNSLIRQTAVTPDGSELAVADFGAQSVYLMNPDSASGNKVFVGGIPGDSNSGPVRIAATSQQTLFVGLGSYAGGLSGCSACLQQMDIATSPVTVEAAPQPQVSLLTSAPILDANSDGSSAYFSFAAATGQPVAGWSATVPAQFAVKQTSRPASDVASAGDGSLIALRIGKTVELRDNNLALRSVTRGSELEGITGRTDVPGIALHPSGALVYLPFLTGPPPASGPFTGLQGGVDIVDANTGRLRTRVMLPEPFSMLSADSDGLHGRFLAIDETGAKLFALTISGLTVVELARVPLGFGSISPGRANAGGGPLTVRGSGFQSGAAVTIGGKAASVMFVDVNTLNITLPASLSSGPQRLTITNPDGEKISIDDAVSVN